MWSTTHGAEGNKEGLGRCSNERLSRVRNVSHGLSAKAGFEVRRGRDTNGKTILGRVKGCHERVTRNIVVSPEKLYSAHATSRYATATLHRAKKFARLYSIYMHRNTCGSGCINPRLCIYGVQFSSAKCSRKCGVFRFKLLFLFYR